MNSIDIVFTMYNIGRASIIVRRSHVPATPKHCMVPLSGHVHNCMEYLMASVYTLIHSLEGYIYSVYT